MVSIAAVVIALSAVVAVEAAFFAAAPMAFSFSFPVFLGHFLMTAIALLDKSEWKLCHIRRLLTMQISPKSPNRLTA